MDPLVCGTPLKVDVAAPVKRVVPAPVDLPAPARVKRVDRAPTRHRISDRVHDELESAIRELRLVPGSVLSETELSLQLGVSRTPLREALSRLVDQRLVTVVSQVGTTVSLISLAEVAEACFIRSALETAAFRRACEAESRDVDGLRLILARQEQAMTDQDADAFFESDEDLHQEVFRLAGFPTVWTLVRGSKSQLDRLRRLHMPEVLTSRQVIEEHIRIVDLLEAGDPTAGAALIEHHAFQILGMVSLVQAEHPEYFTS